MRKLSEDHKAIRLRIILVGSILLASFAVILIRAAKLQFLPAPKIEKRLASRKPRMMPTTKASRGHLLDRNGVELAVSLKTDSVFVDPKLVADRKKVTKELSQVLKISKKQIFRQVKSSGRFAWIKRRIDPLLSTQVRNLDLEGIYLLPEGRRFYPHREMAAHLLGFVNIDLKGLEGVEFAYNKQLKGTPSVLEGVRDARGHFIYTRGVKDPGEPGQDIQLTIDTYIQHAVEVELKEAILETEAEAGMAIALDPHTGEVLALANQPTFNPNIYWNYKPSAWKNRALNYIYEPGSTFKVFLIATALEEGIVSLEDQFYCRKRSLSIQGKIIRDNHHFDWLDIAGILKHSSNIGAAKIGLLLGKEKVLLAAKRFGFGEKTGIDLPGETKGLLRNASTWSEHELASISFGQSIGVSLLQMARAFAAVANGGRLLKPYVVRQIKKRDGAVTYRAKTKVLRKAISSHTSEVLSKLLSQVTTKGGTGALASLPFHQVAGKTGTAQRFDSETGTYSETDYVSSFIGFFPATAPKVVIAIAIDRPRTDNVGGGAVAAPVFAKIATRLVDTLHIPSDLPEPDLKFVEKEPLHEKRATTSRSGKLHAQNRRAKPSGGHQP
jgi:cell division protein FtsI (penicillin-binding protein 3)